MSIKRLNMGVGKIGRCPVHHEKIEHVETFSEDYDVQGVWVHEFYCAKCKIFYEWESEFKFFD